MNQNSKGKIKFAVLKEKIITDFLSLTTDKNHFLYESMNRKIVQLVESGVADKYVREQTIHIPEEKIGPVVLTLDHLGFGFQIWLGSLTIAFMFFLLEHLYYQGTRRVSKCRSATDNKAAFKIALQQITTVNVNRQEIK